MECSDSLSGDMAETSVADFFIAKIWSGERVHQCLDPTMSQKWSGPDPWTEWELTPMITSIVFGQHCTYRSKNVKQIRPNLTEW